jgi:hypothetical protein
MDSYLTEIENANIAGPRIQAESEEEAQRIADTYTSTIGKIKVIGKLIIELDENFMN